MQGGTTSKGRESSATHALGLHPLQLAPHRARDQAPFPPRNAPPRRGDADAVCLLPPDAPRHGAELHARAVFQVGAKATGGAAVRAVRDLEQGKQLDWADCAGGGRAMDEHALRLFLGSLRVSGGVCVAVSNEAGREHGRDGSWKGDAVVLEEKDNAIASHCDAAPEVDEENGQKFL
ncbi:unnamed protein product [Amoebophrya sp. A25]|nr:unnamed protein product [Amoebophrya sp. A25]|eukprot:GSA25T00010003001.1